MASFSIDARQDEADPVHQGRAGREAQHPLLGQPVDAADLDEDGSRYQSGNRRLRRSTAARMKSDDADAEGVRAVPRQVRAGVRSGRASTSRRSHPQNEPNYAQNYPSCLWAPATYVKFVGKYLGPAFTTREHHRQDHARHDVERDGGKDGRSSASVMGDATAKGYVKALGLQWGMLDQRRRR